MGTLKTQKPEPQASTNDLGAETAQQNHERGAAILLSIEIESNFKLYSYRIIPHEVFVERCKELTDAFQKGTL